MSTACGSLVESARGLNMFSPVFGRSRGGFPRCCANS